MNKKMWTMEEALRRWSCYGEKISRAHAPALTWEDRNIGKRSLLVMVDDIAYLAAGLFEGRGDMDRATVAEAVERGTVHGYIDTAALARLAAVL